LSQDTWPERKYPKGLFNKGVRVLNEDHVGHIMKETVNKIVIFGSLVKDLMSPNQKRNR
jgi:hypothetical protein